MSSTSSGNLGLIINKYSGDLILIFTFIWAFIIAILITTQPNRSFDFTFVTNRLSSNLSNVFFLLSASLVGGIFAMMSGLLLKVVAYAIHGSENVISGVGTPLDLSVGIIAAVLYTILFSAAGYIVGVLVQWSRVMIVLLPALFFAALLSGASPFTASGYYIKVIQFLGEESSLLIFTAKILLISVIFYMSALLISNRMEVRK